MPQPAKAVLNPHPDPLPGPQLLHHFARSSAKVDNHAIDFAAADGSRTQLSYAQLDASSDRLARHLRALFQASGVLDRPRIIVPVFIPQSTILYITLLAILKAGAAFCPLALDAPVERLKFVFTDIAASVVVTTSEHRATLPDVDGVSVFLADAEPFSSSPPEIAPYTVSPKAAAYVLYSTRFRSPLIHRRRLQKLASGSTGTPKGVILSHFAVTQSLLAHAPLIPSFSRFLQFASPTFDVSQFEIWFTFSRGATLVVCDRRRLLNDLPAVLNDMHVDGAEFTPTVAGSLLVSRDQAPRLRVLLTIGEMLTRHVIDEFGYTNGANGLLQGMYGPTEAAIHCTMQANFEKGAKAGIIGVPFPTVSAFVIAPKEESDDASGEIKILGIDEVGELAVGGHQLADGYLNRPEKTAEVFIPTKAYGIVYRTGDKARMLQDGTLECLGRIAAGQVKLRGQRVELGEIEHAATTTKGCRTAVASVLNQNLVVFCLAEQDATADAIRAACRKWLPPYMVPNDFVLLHELPQLPSGKIDRKKLEARYLERLSDEDEDEDNEDDEPADEPERVALQVLRNVLGKSIPLAPKAARAGVDSLSAIKIASKLREEGFSVSAVEVLRTKSARTLASLLRKRAKRDDSATHRRHDFAALRRNVGDALPNEDARQIESVYPCTPLQASMLAETRQDRRAYCNWIQFAFDSKVTVDQIKQSFRSLVRRHQILRTGFAAIDTGTFGFAQIVWKDSVAPVINVVQDATFDHELTAEIDTYLHPIDLQVTVKKDQALALLRIHHSLYDGWTIDLLMREWHDLLERSPITSQTPPQFNAVADFYFEASRNGEAESKEYWRAMLMGYDPFRFPRLTLSENTTQSGLGIISSSIDTTAETIAALLPDSAHAQTLFQTAFMYLVSLYSGATDVVVGTVTSGRTIPVTGIEEILGPCIATLPLRATIDECETALQAVTPIAKRGRSMLEHCTLPLTEIKRLVGVEPGQELFDTLFIWQESLQSHKNEDRLVKVSDSEDHLEFNLIVEVEPRADQLNLLLRYNKAVIPQGHAEIFLDQLKWLCQAMIQDMSCPLMTLLRSAPTSLLSTSPITGKSRIAANKESDFAALVGAIGHLMYDEEEQDQHPSIAGASVGRMLCDGTVVEAQAAGSVRLPVEHELLELANASKRLPEIQDALALLLPSESQDHMDRPTIVCFWVPRDHQSEQMHVLEVDARSKSSAARLYDHLQSSLPAYLLPHALVPLSVIRNHDKSLTDAIDIDVLRKAILAFQVEKISIELEEDWSSREIQLANVISAITDVSVARIQKRTSFFSLGINSISAISLARSLRSKLLVDIKAMDIIRYSNIARLASHIEQNSHDSPSLIDVNSVFKSSFRSQVTGDAEARGLSVSKILPCTPLQEAMLSAEMSSKTSNAYGNHTLFKIHGDVQRLCKSIQNMCSRHDILRTCFVSTNDPTYAFAQVVLLSAQPNILRIPLKDYDIARKVQDEVSTGIKAVDTFSPPVAVKILEGSNEEYLLLSLHHATYDGQAFETLLSEIQMCYHGEDLSSTPSYESFLAQALAIDEVKSEKFWNAQLKDFVSIPFPKLIDGVGRPAVTTKVVDVSLSLVKSVAQNNSTTMLNVLQAAWVKVLSFFTDATDVCFGNVLSGRTISMEGIENLVAPCFNTLPVRVTLSPERPTEHLIATLSTINTKSLEHQFTPLRRIVREWNKEGQKLFDTLFILQNPSVPLDRSIWNMESDAGNMGFPVVLELLPHVIEDSIAINLHHDGTVIDSKIGDDLLSRYEGYLQEVVNSRSDSQTRSPSKTVFEAYPAAERSFTPNRIDLNRISTRMHRLIPSIKDAIVEAADLQSLLVFVTLQFDQVDAESVLEQVRHLVSSQIPSGVRLAHLECLDEIPLSPSSRPSRQKLLVRYHRAQAAHLQFFDGKSLSLAEQNIKEIFMRFTSIPSAQVTKQKTIYQLGLDSINAIQIAKTLRENGISATAEDVLQYPTIEALASATEPRNRQEKSISSFDFSSFERKHREEACKEAHCTWSDVEMILPCTPTQSGMLAQFRHSGGSSYLNSWTWDLPNDIDTHRLQDAFEAITAKHVMLRAGFVALQSPDFPFAAVVYKPNSVGGHNSVAINRDLNVERLRNATAQDILQASYVPTWRASISQGSGSRQMNFTGLHSLFDAETLAMFFGDLKDAYLGRKLTRSLDVRPLASAMLVGAEDSNREHKTFWTRELENMTVCRFPNLTPDWVTERTLLKETHISDVPASSIFESCQILGVNLQAALQVAYARLLSSYTGDSDVCFGIVLSGRDTEGASDIAFPSAVTLPFHLEVGDDIGKMLKQTVKFNTNVRRHQFTPLTEIQRWTGSAKSALFDSILVYQRSGTVDEESPWTLVEERATVEYAVSLEIKPTKAGCHQFSLVFQSDTITSEHGRLFLQQFDYILQDTLQMSLEHKTRQNLLSIFPAKEAEIPTDVKYLHEFVEQTALRDPEHVALEFHNHIDSKSKPQTWTYKELDSMGNRIGHYLLKHGHQPGGLLAICFDKCPEASFATYGILKSGNGFVAIDHSAPIGRKRFVIQDSKAGAILTTSKLAAELQTEVSVPVIAVDAIELKPLPWTKPDIESMIDLDATSYCLYTSGSTGTPKGCLISHHNAVQGLMAFKRIFACRWDTQSRWLQFASFHFDVSVLEQFWSWMVGITVVSTPRDILFEDLPGNLRRLRITHLDLTPSLARLITPTDVPSLCGGVFITGGEQLRQEVLDAWGDTGVIHNFYGPSECTIGVTVNPGVGKNGKTSNIGKQFDNVASYVLKPNSHEPVVKGAVGELCVSGHLLGKGYLNRDDLTKERFPYVAAFKDRIYRTGDLVRQLHDGSIDFLGRIDDQVKLRGQRLELGEITGAVKSISEWIKDAHTMVVKDKDRQTEQIVAFAVPTEDDQVRDRMEKEIWTSCKSKLPPYMIPSRLIWIEGALPLTANNKVDAKALRSIFDSQAKADANMRPDQNERKSLSGKEEHAIARALARCLKLSENDLYASTNMFQSGLDSVLVFNFVRALQGEGLKAASAQTVMSCATIHDLALKLGAGESSDKGSIQAAKQLISATHQRYRSQLARKLDLDSSNIEMVAPCTPLQHGMIVRASCSGPGKQLYLNEFRFTLKHTTDVQKLRGAWARVIEAVPILRTAFAQMGETFVQYALARKSALLEAIFRERKGSSGPEKPLSVVFTKPGKAHIMTVEIFHALYDAIAFELVMKKVSEEYASTNHGQDVIYGPSFFDALPFGPLRRSKGAKQFWQQHLQGSQTAFLADGEEAQGAKLSTARIAGLHDLDNVRKSSLVTHQAIIQTLWAAILQTKLTLPLIIGMVVSGRTLDLQDADEVIGPMFNTIPFFAGLKEDDTFVTAAQRSHRFNTEALPHQHTSLHEISKWRSNSTRKDLFDTLFVFQKSALSAADAQLWEANGSSAEADYPLAFEAIQVDDETVDVNLVASGSSFGEKDCHELLNLFETSLRKVIKNPTVSLVELLGEDYAKACSNEKATANGVDQDSQPEFDWHSSDQRQRTIADILCSIGNVKLSQVHPHTSVLELGLDSIDAIKLSSRMRKNGLNISVSSIMKAPTLIDIAQNATEDANDQRTDDLLQNYQAIKNSLKSSIGDASSRFQDVLPVTPLQEAMIAEMIATDYENYFNFDVLKVHSSINTQQLERAWIQLVDIHDVLRLGFVECEDGTTPFSFVQVLHSKGIGKDLWRTETASITDWTEIHSIHRRLIINSIAKPPVRISLVSTSDQQRYLVLSIAHALYDGFSLGLLHQDFQTAYGDMLQARPSFEPALARVLDGTGKTSQAYWRETLRGAKACSIPQRSNGNEKLIHRTELTGKLPSAAVEKFCRAQSITVQTLGVTCWSMVVSSFTGMLDTVFGLVLSGRDDEKAQTIAFPLMNTVALRSIIHGTCAGLLQYTQSNLADISQHQYFPLRNAQAMSDAKGERLFNSIFIYQKRPSTDSEKHQVYESLGGGSQLEYPVAVELETSAEHLTWRAACNDLYFGADDANALLESLDSVLQRIIQDPDADAVDFQDNGFSVGGLAAPYVTSPSATPKPAPNEDFKGRVLEGAAVQAQDTLLDILSKLSNVPLASIHSDYTLFHLGLDSISAIKVSTMMKSEGFTLSVSELLKARTVSGIAVAAVTKPQEETAFSFDQDIVRKTVDALSPTRILYKANIDPGAVETILPASAVQTYMLQMWQNSKGALFYPTFTYLLKGSVSVWEVEKTWKAIVSETPVLRSIFLPTLDSTTPFLQVVLKADSVDHRKPQPAVSLDTHAHDPAGVTIDLQIHHALYDAVSLASIVQLLAQRCYTKPELKTPLSLSTLVAPSLGSQAVSIRKDFWVSYFGDVEPITIPSMASFTPRTENYEPALMPRSSVAQLFSLSKSGGLSPSALVLAAVAKALSNQFPSLLLKLKSGKQALPLGLYLSSRTQETEALIAPALTLLPILIHEPQTSRLADIAKRAQEDLQTLRTNASVMGSSLHEILQWTGVPIDVFFNFIRESNSAQAAEKDSSPAPRIEVVDKNHRTHREIKQAREVARKGSGEGDTTTTMLDTEKQLDMMHSTLKEVQAAYRPTIDIESAVRDGQLDFGIFGPQERLHEGQAKAFAWEVKTILEGAEQ